MGMDGVLMVSPLLEVTPPAHGHERSWDNFFTCSCQCAVDTGDTNFQVCHPGNFPQHTVCLRTQKDIISRVYSKGSGFPENRKSHQHIELMFFIHEPILFFATQLVYLNFDPVAVKMDAAFKNTILPCSQLLGELQHQEKHPMYAAVAFSLVVWLKPQQ